MEKQIEFRRLVGTVFSFPVFFCILLLVNGFSNGQEPQLTQSEFSDALIKAYSANNEEKATSLIREYRLFVKPAVNVLIKESLVAELKGKAGESQQAFLMAEKTAESFESIFGEKSLSIAVNYLTNWSKNQKETKLIADSLYSEGTKYRLGNEPEKAIALFERVLVLYRSIGDERGEAEVLGGLGAVYYNNVLDYEVALKYYKEALIKREIVDDKALIGNTLNSLGSVTYSYLEDYPQAILYYDKAEAIRVEIGDNAGLRTTRSYKANALKTWGKQLNITGRFTEALEVLEKAYEIDRSLEDGSETGEVLSYMGYVYSKLGDYKTAAAKLTEAVKIMTEENDTLGLAGVYNHFGIVLQRAGRTEKALEYYNNSLEIYEEANDLTDEIPVIDNLGTLFFDLKDYSRAEDYHIRGLKICRELKDQEKEIDYLLNLANDQIFLGKPDEALLNYEAGLKIARTLKNPDIIWRITVGMAECYEARGEYEKVVELNDSALNLLDSLRNTLQSEELRATLMARERYVFEDIIDFLATLHEKDRTKGYDRLAFSYAERSKSRVLLDLLARSLADTSKDNPNSAYADKLNSQPISIDEVKKLCPDKNTVVLEYSVGDSSSCLWVITAMDHWLFKIPRRKILQEQIETIRFAILDPGQGISDFFTQAGNTLYNELIKPAEPFLSRKSKLIIIPDGVLNYLPFEVLLNENKKPDAAASYSDIPYLVRKYPISYGQSASVLKTLIAQNVKEGESFSENKKLLAFGDPVYEDTLANSHAKYPRLKFSGEEVNQIATFFNNGSAKIYLRKDATEENVKQDGEIGKFNYIHFATHGNIDEVKPDLSSLVLTQDNNSEEDGFLQASEIFNLKLNADLVVLSACQTGMGKLIRGEGIIGLTRAFMYAGSPAVMVSLWSVSDASTATLMGEFYKNLIKKKLSKTDALRNAQITLLKDEKFAHPFYWAPFVLLGDWR
jgi:CHAT domain-containing protein/Tfp pilus assembly protein PilF